MVCLINIPVNTFLNIKRLRVKTLQTTVYAINNLMDLQENIIKSCWLSNRTIIFDLDKTRFIIEDYNKLLR